MTPKFSQLTEHEKRACSVDFCGIMGCLSPTLSHMDARQSI